jgi:hypothetical protein
MSAHFTNAFLDILTIFWNRVNYSMLIAYPPVRSYNTGGSKKTQGGERGKRGGERGEGRRGRGKEGEGESYFLLSPLLFTLLPSPPLRIIPMLPSVYVPPLSGRGVVCMRG